MDARGQRALARRNRREVAAVVQEGPREEEIVESDTQRKKRFSRSEKPSLYVFVFQVQGLEVDLQQQRFLPQSIRECG